VIPRNLAISTTLVLAIPACAVIYFYTQFESPPLPVIITPFAPPGTSCESWKKVWEASSPRHRLPVMLLPCISGEAGDLPAGSTVAAILDPNLPEPGGSGPAGNRRDLFQIRINPKTVNTWTWRHEVRHILAGHSAIATRVPFGFRRATNALLDLAFIDAYLLFGDGWHDGWSALLAALILAALMAAWMRSGGKDWQRGRTG
jgi:hypothetical protein